MSTWIGLAAVAAAWSTPAEAGDVEDIVHVIVMAGQSNMVGGASVEDVDPVLQPWIEEMPAVPYRQWLNGSEHGQDAWDAHLQPRAIHFGPEMAFTHRLAEARPNHQIAIIKMAQNGTNLGCTWHPDGCGHHLYQMLKNITLYWIEDLERDGIEARLAGFVWVQGEADSTAAWAAASYYENLRDLVETLRIDLHRPELPFVAVRVHPRDIDYAYNPEVRAAMRTLSVEDPWVDSVGISDLALRDDDIHLAADSMVHAGIRAADSFLAIGCLDTVEEAPDCWGDFDGDEDLGVPDILELLSAWGPCGP
ncbi:MAG: sialate O-acetylesterase [Phycisphaerales bacterium]|jgi:hypothetical protein|nr:sialate O-acetylesterase [Phycisphaerales bacterium]